MGSFLRAVRYMKDFWKVIIRGENDDLTRQTIAIQEELHRMRNQRQTTDQIQEAAALNQARGAVEKLRELHDSLLLAEKAASEFACKIGDLAKSNLEAEEEVQRKIRMKFLMQQKNLFLNGPVSDGLSQLNKQVEVGQVLSTDKNDHILLTGNGSAIKNIDEGHEVVEVFSTDKDDGISLSATESPTRNTEVEEIFATDKDDQISLSGNESPTRNTEGVEVFSTDKDDHITPSINEEACDTRTKHDEHDTRKVLYTDKDHQVSQSGNMEMDEPRIIDEELEVGKVLLTDQDDHISPSGNGETSRAQMLARVMDEARKQARLDEKVHVEALERNKAILEKAIEAQAQAEGKSMS